MAQTAPSREVKLTFAQIAPPPGSMALRGVNPNGGIEFGMRSDEVASKAVLNLEYTPSPSLLPVQSQLKVYLNDELMGVLPVTKEQLGKKTLAQVPINPLFITDFNRVRLEFVGHYRDVCENPASSTLWLDIGRNSALDLTYNMLAVNNDLSHFPVPFFDPRDNRPVTLPIVFADMPDLAQQQAASIVASWFGSRAGWRGQRFPVLYNHLPDRNAIVFATNDRRPDFLRDHPAVNAPVIEMMSHPDNPYVKLLVVFGRDDKDLLQAAKGIAQGNILFRGSSVVVNDVKPLLARKPYDAPNWVRTDRPVTFGELKTYEEQLQSSGLEPAPINVSLNLPPDLYLLRSNGIDMDLNYRYTSPPTNQWNSNIQELAGRLQSNQVLESANRLRDSGKEREAEALLRQQPPSTRIALTLADWAQQRGDNEAARAAYDAVLAREPGNVDAMLGRVEIDIAQGDNAAARAQLAALPASQITSLNMQRRVAQAQLQLGDITAAARTFNRITPQAKAQPPSMESAMVLRDAAAFQAQTGEPQRALETYKDAMVAAAITPVRPQDNDTFTRLTRNDEKDDWLKRGVRSDAAELYRQQDLNVTLAHDYWGSSGTGGYSDLKAHTTMLQVDAPWSDGRAFFRTDMVNMDVGRFSTDADGKYDNNWGTCTLEKCSGHRSQADTGASVAVGWQNEIWRWDIGTTPMGFNVVDDPS